MGLARKKKSRIKFDLKTLRAFFSLRVLRGKKGFWPSLIHTGFLAGIWGGIVLFFFLLYCAWDLPGTWKSPVMPEKNAITVLDEKGKVLARFGDIRGENINVAKLPAYVREAVLAIEDRRFYEHAGIDPWGILRAMAANILAGRFVQGGSTVTQQLAKNLFLSRDKTIKRKAQEAILALWLEHEFTKDEILSAYLNRVYFGSGAYGIDAAARIYFGKNASRLTLWETAVVIGLLKAPSRYSPASNPDLAAQRARVVLGAMVDAGYMTETKKAGVVETDLALVPRVDASGMQLYFADWVLEQIGEYVTVLDEDIVVKTTLSSEMQALSSSKISGFVTARGKDGRFGQAAFLAMLPDGAVKAMVGGVDYRQSQFNRTTQARRQPGSAFKPFVYLAALEKGFSADDKMEDRPIDDGKYRPQNFDGKYKGRVTLEQALAHSLNSVAVRLARDTGLAAVINAARRLGVASPLRADLSLALGSSEMTMLELVSGYAAFANGGAAIAPYAIVEIENKNGHVLYRREIPAFDRAADRGDINALVRMMEGVVAFGTGRAAQIPGYGVAGKTGTSEASRDAWFIGFTDDVVAGVWLGNDDNSPMQDVTGGSAAAHLWREVMAPALDKGVIRYRPAWGLKGGGIFGFWRDGNEEAPQFNQ